MFKALTAQLGKIIIPITLLVTASASANEPYQLIKLKNKINRKTVQEISIQLKNLGELDAEIGGDVYEAKTRLVFYAVGNKAVDYYSNLATDPSSLQMLEKIITQFDDMSSESEQECKDVDDYTKLESSILKQARELKGEFEDFNSKLKRFSVDLKEYALTHYLKKEYTPLKLSRVATYHIHDNDTEPSDTDICIRKNSELPELVISFNVSEKKSFKLYYTHQGFHGLVGEYKLKR